MKLWLVKGHDTPPTMMACLCRPGRLWELEATAHRQHQFNMHASRHHAKWPPVLSLLIGVIIIVGGWL